MKFKDWVDHVGVPLCTLARKIGVNHITVRTLYHGKNTSGKVIKPSWEIMRKVIYYTEGKVTANDLLDIDMKAIRRESNRRGKKCTPQPNQ